MQVIAHLQCQLVRPRGQLHVDEVLPVAEMHPRRGARDDRVGGQAVSVHANVIVAERRPGLGDGPLRHRGDGEILRAEFELDGALDGRAVLRLDEEYSRPAWAAPGAYE